MRAFSGLCLVAAALTWPGASAVFARDERPSDTSQDESRKIEFFEKQVRPLLANRCFTCHSANTNSKGGLRVDDRLGLLVGGNRGAAVIPGDPENSLLIKAVSYADKKLQMPPEKQLEPDQVTILKTWIQDGAAWPKVELPAEIGELAADYEQLKQGHWAWQPLRQVQPPPVRDEAWVRSDLDRFVLAKLTEKGLQPVGDADRRTLIRRLSFDLTGLPPERADVEAFVADSSPDAVAALVDRWLASSGYGERWGRHWLDLARYAESTGSARNLPFPHAWRYRDYVIRAFNSDKRYDQFLREQIAGDLLPADSPAEKSEQRVATGFLALGVKDVNQRFKVRYIMDNVDEQIDAVSRAVLALTVSCARCHDHKFDPIPTADYYALAGIFRSTDLCAGLRNKMGGGGLDYYDTSMLISLGEQGDGSLSEKVAAAKLAYERARDEFQKIAGTPEGRKVGADGRPAQFEFRQRMNRAQAEYLALSDPALTGSVALGVRDSSSVGDTEIRIRGEAEKLGPVVPRGYLSAVPVPDAPPVNGEQSGRLELAAWLTSAQNPLTPRVMVNRVWQHLFGQGLVRTVDNFGVTGDTPSHPELLDFLAVRFVQEGWSVRRLIRSMLLSHTYQLGADAPAKNLAADPANRWLWRHAPRRLDAEEIRDTMLFAAGQLDPTPPIASPAKDLKVIELRNDGVEARRLTAAANTSRHRAVYLPLLRGLTPHALQVFDFAEQGMVTGSRDTTTVAPQALYMLNDAFVRHQALAMAERLLADPDQIDARRIDQIYQRALGRAATTQEIERAAGYLVTYEDLLLTERRAAESRLARATEDRSSPRPGTVEVTATNQAAKAAVPADPDESGGADEAPPEVTVQAETPRAAAWASLCQALFGTAEFRYLR